MNSLDLVFGRGSYLLERLGRGWDGELDWLGGVLTVVEREIVEEGVLNY